LVVAECSRDKGPNPLQLTEHLFSDVARDNPWGRYLRLRGFPQPKHGQSLPRRARRGSVRSITVGDFPHFRVHGYRRAGPLEPLPLRPGRARKRLTYVSCTGSSTSITSSAATSYQ
jgi:hypothetical protein